MSRRIVVEALVVVVQLRAEELRAGSGGRPTPRRRSPTPRGRPPPDPSGAGPRDVAGDAARRDLVRGGPELDEPPGVRVVLDARPLQEPDRAPLTAAYLDGLLGAFDAEPLDGRVVRVPAPLATSTTRRRAFTRPRGRRPPAAAADPPAPLGGPDRRPVPAARGRASGPPGGPTAAARPARVYHAVGAGPLPIASGLPVVVTLLDLAPWELPEAYQRTASDAVRPAAARPAAARRGRGDRRDRGDGGAARRLLHLRRDRIRVVPLAPRPAFAFWPSGAAPRSSDPTAAADDGRAERERLGLPERYLVYSGRYDARQDLATLLAALEPSPERPPGRPARRRRLAAAGPPLGARPDDRAALARAAAARSASATRSPTRRACPTSGWPRSSAARGRRSCPSSPRRPGLPAIEALACGTPVVASAVGALPEVVGAAGILVEPRDPERLAVGPRDGLGRRRVHARPGRGWRSDRARRRAPDVGRRGPGDAGGSTRRSRRRPPTARRRRGPAAGRRRGAAISSASAIGRARRPATPPAAVRACRP